MMSKRVLIAAVSIWLTGCAHMDLNSAVVTHNTIRAAAALTSDGVRAELLQGIHYAR